MSAGKLTPKQLAFVEAYAGPSQGNATDAARRAGYKGNADVLKVTGAKNLARPAVAAALAELTKQVRGHAFLSARTRQERLALVAGGEVLDTYVLKDGTVVRAAPSLRTQALCSEQLNRMQGIYLATDALVERLQDVKPRMSKEAYRELLIALQSD